MESKELLKNMCDIFFKDISYVVSKDELVKSTTLSKFFGDKNRIIPTKKICKLIIDKCRYYMYSKEEEDIRTFSFKVVYFLSSKMKRNYSFLNVLNTNDDTIDYERRDYLFLILEAIINNTCKSAEIDLDELSTIIDELLGYYRVDFKGRIERKMTAAEFIEYQSFTAISMEQIKNMSNIYNSGIELQLRKEYNNALENLNFLTDLLKEILEAPDYSRLKNAFKDRWKDLRAGTLLLSKASFDTDWKLNMFKNLISGGINIYCIHKYFDFIHDLLKCDKLDMLSDSSKLFYEDCIRKYAITYTPSWKHECFYNVSCGIISEYSFYQVVNYYNYNHSYHEGIKKMYEYYNTIKKLREQYCNENELELFMKPYNCDEKLNVDLSANTWLFGNSTYAELEKLICQIINYLSFQAMIYDQYCTG